MSKKVSKKQKQETTEVVIKSVLTEDQKSELYDKILEQEEIIEANHYTSQEAVDAYVKRREYLNQFNKDEADEIAQPFKERHDKIVMDKKNERREKEWEVKKQRIENRMEQKENIFDSIPVEE